MQARNLNDSDDLPKYVSKEFNKDFIKNNYSPFEQYFFLYYVEICKIASPYYIKMVDLLGKQLQFVNRVSKIVSEYSKLNGPDLRNIDKQEEFFQRAAEAAEDGDLLIEEIENALKDEKYAVLREDLFEIDYKDFKNPMHNYEKAFFNNYDKAVEESLTKKYSPGKDKDSILIEIGGKEFSLSIDKLKEAFRSPLSKVFKDTTADKIPPTIKEMVADIDALIKAANARRNKVIRDFENTQSYRDVIVDRANDIDTIIQYLRHLSGDQTVKTPQVENHPASPTPARLSISSDDNADSKEDHSPLHSSRSHSSNSSAGSSTLSKGTNGSPNQSANNSPPLSPTHADTAKLSSLSITMYGSGSAAQKPLTSPQTPVQKSSAKARFC